MKAKSFLFPSELKVTKVNPKKSKNQKNTKGNGGWGDHRDRALCLNMASSSSRGGNRTLAQNVIKDLNLTLKPWRCMQKYKRAFMKTMRNIYLLLWCTVSPTICEIGSWWYSFFQNFTHFHSGGCIWSWKSFRMWNSYKNRQMKWENFTKNK